MLLRYFNHVIYRLLLGDHFYKSQSSLSQVLTLGNKLRKKPISFFNIINAISIGSLLQLR